MNKELIDSNVNWIGKIPSHWDIKPLGTYLKERKEKVSDADYEPLSVTKNGIVPQLDNAAKSDAHDDRKKVCIGDFVINSRSDRKQSCGLSNLNGSVSLINIVLENRMFYSNYLKYLLDNSMFAEEFYSNGHGIVADLWTTRYEEMRKIMLPIPSFKEQEQIAKYLDKKVDLINETVENNKIEIKLLEEYEKSVILDKVMHGLNENRDFKQINIDNINKIPSNWKITKLKRYINIFNGKDCVKDLDSNNIPVYGSGGIFGYTNNYLYDGESLLLGRKGTIDRPILVNGRFWTVDTMFYSIPKENCNLKYVYYFMKVLNWEKYIMGTALPSMTQTILNDINIPWLSLEEQKEISEYLDKFCKSILEVTSYRKSIIEKLEEYKKSLIYEAVTGKIEV